MKNELKNKKYYLNLNYSMIVKKDDGEYVAYYKEYPKITGCGNDEIEAIMDLKEAFSCLLDTLIANGEEVIEPKVAEKKVRINVLLPEKLVKSIGSETKNRSLFLTKAAQYVLDNKIALHGFKHA